MSITKILGHSWKVTLPIGAEEKPKEILPSALDNYSDEFLHYDDSVRGVVFRCPTNGVSTSGSSYPRCEARQMDSDTKRSAWSTLVGRNRLTAVLALNEIPVGPKREVVLMQIHGGDDDITTFRFNGFVDSLTEGDLWITNGNNSRAFKVGRIKLNEKIKIGLDVKGGKIAYNFNDELLSFILESTDHSCYFKLGCYPQAKATTFLPDKSPDAGQVTVYEVWLNDDHEEPEVPVEEFETQVLRQLDEIKTILTQFIMEYEDRVEAIREAL